MKRFLIALALSAVTVFPARADELPAVYFGEWCANVNGQFYQTTEQCEYNTITITRNELREIEGGCRFRSIRNMKVRWPYNPTVEIIARCVGEGSVGINRLRLIYAKGTLWIESKNLREIDSEERRKQR